VTVTQDSNIVSRSRGDRQLRGSTPLSRGPDGSRIQAIAEPDQPNHTFRPEPGRKTAAHLFASSRVELSLLASILHQSSCVAVIRAIDRTLPPMIPRAVTGNGALESARRTLSSPIYDSDGTQLACLELQTDDAGDATTTDTLLRSIANSAARAISERLFRIFYLRHWILAAQPIGAPDKSVLLALDRNKQVVGADRASRTILEQTALDSQRRVALSALFHSTRSIFHGGRHCERSLRLLGVNDDAPWFALITPPHLSDTRMAYGNRVLLHTQPRVDTLTSLSAAGIDAEEFGGLSPHVCQRIDELIDARLEARINIAKLAANFGISASHFFRRFRKSFGMPPHAYIMRRRLSLAQDLLAETDISLTEIALKTGFADQSHFSRNFHRFTGVAPRAFRMQYG
jgi:AraC-like DNA-binding protein